MKISIVNDCAYVGMNVSDELKKRGYFVDYYPRSRKIFDKTFRILNRIIRTNADIFHVNYALQDAFLVSILKRLDVLHCHGSDLRWKIYGKWGLIIKINLMKARKVLVSTPDILDISKNHNITSEYLPNPINTNFFKNAEGFSKDSSKLTFIYANKYDEKSKGTETFLKYFKKVKKKNWVLKFIKDVPHHLMPHIYNSGDIVVGEFKAGILTNVALEGMACEKPVISNVDEELYGQEIPAIKLEDISSLSNENILDYYGKKGRSYVIANHEVKKIVSKLITIYEELLEN